MTHIRRSTDFKTHLLAKLDEQRFLQSPLTDLQLSVNSKLYNVHKCLLIATSDYFDAMLRSGMQESRQDVIELKGLSSEGIEQTLNFIYTGQLSLNENNIDDVLRAVSHLQLKFALNICEEFLFDILNTNNCVNILNLVEFYSLKAIRPKIDNFILKNFIQLVQNKMFYKLNIDQMCFYLSKDNLKLYPESKVFKICTEWIENYNKNNNNNKLNNDNLYNLFKSVRFLTMNVDDFIKKVSRHKILQSSAELNELVIEAYEFFSLSKCQFTCASTRSKIRNKPLMVCVNESMYVLDGRDESWQYLCQSNATSKILSQKFAVVNNFLYACGGYSEKERETCNKCYRFDPRSAQWSNIASMKEKRQFFTLATSNDCIIAIGGVYGNIGNFYATHPINSPFEFYSIEQDTWTQSEIKSSLLPILKWPGACVFSQNSGQKIFIVGGKLTEKNSLCQQSYLVDLETSNVELCEPPITCRFNPSVFYSDNKIILFAGDDEKFRLAPCIELFDLESHQWTEIATIPISLSYQCISTTRLVDSRIEYLIEEHDGPQSEFYELSSSSFDFKTKKFEPLVQLPIPGTLASKWCYLTFPLEYLEKYHVNKNQTNDR